MGTRRSSPRWFEATRRSSPGRRSSAGAESYGEGCRAGNSIEAESIAVRSRRTSPSRRMRMSARSSAGYAPAGRFLETTEPFNPGTRRFRAAWVTANVREIARDQRSPSAPARTWDAGHRTTRAVSRERVEPKRLAVACCIGAGGRRTSLSASRTMASVFGRTETVVCQRSCSVLRRARSDRSSGVQRQRSTRRGRTGASWLARSPGALSLTTGAGSQKVLGSPNRGRRSLHTGGEGSGA